MVEHGQNGLPRMTNGVVRVRGAGDADQHLDTVGIGHFSNRAGRTQTDNREAPAQPCVLAAIDDSPAAIVVARYAAELSGRLGATSRSSTLFDQRVFPHSILLSESRTS
jgi:hypothetical protein